MTPLRPIEMLVYGLLIILLIIAVVMAFLNPDAFAAKPVYQKF